MTSKMSPLRQKYVMTSKGSSRRQKHVMTIFQEFVIIFQGVRYDVNNAS